MSDDLLDDSLLKVSFTARLRNEMRIAAIWARFLGIILMLIALFNVLKSLAVGANIFSALLSAALVAVPSLALILFGNKVTKALRDNDQYEFENGLQRLKLYFKYCAIVVLCICGLVLIVALFAIPF